MRNPDGETSPSETPRETMTMGEAASLLGVSTLSVRRMCKLYEKNSAMGLPFSWTSPTLGRVDVNGRKLRGHRRPFADAVIEMAIEMGRLPGAENPPTDTLDS